MDETVKGDKDIRCTSPSFAIDASNMYPKADGRRSTENY